MSSLPPDYLSLFLFILPAPTSLHFISSLLSLPLYPFPLMSSLPFPLPYLPPSLPPPQSPVTSIPFIHPVFPIHLSFLIFSSPSPARCLVGLCGPWTRLKAWKMKIFGLPSLMLTDLDRPCSFQVSWYILVHADISSWMTSVCLSGNVTVRPSVCLSVSLFFCSFNPYYSG